MNSIIKNNLKQLRTLCEKYEVKVLYVFGSASTEDLLPSSDIDILISFKDITIEQYTENYFSLHNDLEKLFDRKIDLITENSLRNPYFIEGVEKTKKLLYAA